MKKLDDEYGPAADWSRLDPSHLYAVGQRIQNLAGEIALLREEGRRRDDKIDGVRETAEEVRQELANTAKELNDLVHAQMTDADIKTLRSIILNYERKVWVSAAALKYLGWISATATVVWLLHEPLGKFLAWLGRAGS